MKKYIISIEKSKEYNASSKARKDAETILINMGYERFVFSGENSGEGKRLKQLLLLYSNLKNWKKLNNSVGRNSIVVVQYPHYPLKTAYMLTRILPRMQKKRHTCFVALVHDLNSIRGFYGNSAKYSDGKLLPIFDYIICHNEKMKEYLIKQGIDEKKLICLGLFDYLTSEVPNKHKVEDGIAIAGNLDSEKSGYISQFIQEYAGKFPIHLYGHGLKEENIPKGRNVIYHGAFNPDELPGKLEGAFGIVWDGNQLNTCSGKMGNYLRYNNPHKASLYIVSGMPIITWNQAAISDIIEKNDLGVVVENLLVISKVINNFNYSKCIENVKRIKLNGELLEKAIRRVELHNDN